ncbi:hypothetical protein [Frankia casuarinae]|uniref:hypothetical protein n=1 Tax=Frankia casuarinae (strain DSM 45818 / CECT 9043 / HFP020203 / CcI3) TaxID=106370 RepID=UPI000A0F8F4C|nr:hypothetical protein [Frankia casuarinae]
MSVESLPDLDMLWMGLCSTIRHGATAARLGAYTPGVVDALEPGVTPWAARMLAAEDLIRNAAAGLDSPQDRAVRLLLGLSPGTAGLRVSTRRARAADALRIAPASLRGDREHALMWDLAVQVCKLLLQR